MEKNLEFMVLFYASLTINSSSKTADNTTLPPQTYKEMIISSQKNINKSLDNITTLLKRSDLPFETETSCINDFLETQADIISLRKNPPTDPAALLKELDMKFLLLHKCFTDILMYKEVTQDIDDCSNEIFEDEKPLLKKTKTELIQLYKEQVASLMEGDRFKKKYPDATEREKIEYRDFSCQRLLKGQVSNNLQRKKRTKRKKA